MTVNIVLTLITMHFLRTSTVSTELVLMTTANYGLSLDSSRAPKIHGGDDAHASAGAHPQPAALLPQHDSGTRLLVTRGRRRQNRL